MENVLSEKRIYKVEVTLKNNKKHIEMVKAENDLAAIDMVYIHYITDLKENVLDIRII